MILISPIMAALSTKAFLPDSGSSSFVYPLFFLSFDVKKRGQKAFIFHSKKTPSPRRLNRRGGRRLHEDARPSPAKASLNVFTGRSIVEHLKSSRELAERRIYGYIVANGSSGHNRSTCRSSCLVVPRQANRHPLRGPRGRTTWESEHPESMTLADSLIAGHRSSTRQSCL